jgi:excisionase family DNA binding protein
VKSANRPNQSESGQLITLREAGRRAGLGLRQLERACARAELPIYRVGGWRRVHWSDVELWLARQRAEPTQERALLPWTLRAAARFVAELDGDLNTARAALDLLEAER